jgi:hypothetical protein
MEPNIILGQQPGDAKDLKRGVYINPEQRIAYTIIGRYLHDQTR